MGAEDSPTLPAMPPRLCASLGRRGVSSPCSCHAWGMVRGLPGELLTNTGDCRLSNEGNVGSWVMLGEKAAAMWPLRNGDGNWKWVAAPPLPPGPPGAAEPWVTWGLSVAMGLRELQKWMGIMGVCCAPPRPGMGLVRKMGVFRLPSWVVWPGRGMLAKPADLSGWLTVGLGMGKGDMGMDSRLRGRG